MNIYEVKHKIEQLLKEGVDENTEVIIIDEETALEYEITKAFYNDIDKVLEVKAMSLL